MIRNHLHKEAPVHSAPPPGCPVPTNHLSLALPVTSTAGQGGIAPQDQAFAAAISWTAKEAAPRRLNGSDATRSLVDGLAVRGGPSQASH